jgi:hypothetical protein
MTVATAPHPLVLVRLVPGLRSDNATVISCHAPDDLTRRGQRDDL